MSVLQEAVLAEQLKLAAQRQKNHIFFEKMVAFQTGVGPAPNVDEFVEWRDSVQQILFEKKIDSDFSKL